MKSRRLNRPERASSSSAISKARSAARPNPDPSKAPAGRPGRALGLMERRGRVEAQVLPGEATPHHFDVHRLLLRPHEDPGDFPGESIAADHAEADEASGDDARELPFRLLPVRLLRFRPVGSCAAGRRWRLGWKRRPTGFRPGVRWRWTARRRQQARGGTLSC